MLLFRSEEHVEHWLQTWRLPKGALLTLEQCWRLAKTWYSADRRAPDWQRFNHQETEAILAGLGLTSDFWKLD